MLYDPASQRVFTFNGHGGDATAIDAATGKPVGTIPLGGKPEFAAADGEGHIYNNLEDKSELLQIDTQKLTVTARWPLAPCEEPSGLAMDVKHRRLFAGCHNKMMAVVDADSGKVLATPAIGQGVDANGFDPGYQFAFSSNGDGTLTVVHEDSPEKFTAVASVPTQRGARTMALDLKKHRVFLVTAEFGPPPAPTPDRPHPRPQAIPGRLRCWCLESEHPRTERVNFIDPRPHRLKTHPPRQLRRRGALSEPHWRAEQQWVYFLILVALALLPYLKSLRNGFVYDDFDQVLANPYLRNFHHLREIFTSSVWSFMGDFRGSSNYYRPLMSLGYLFCYQLFGPHALGFHVANLLANVGVVLLVFLVTLKMFRSSAGGAGGGVYLCAPPHSQRSGELDCRGHRTRVGVLLSSDLWVFPRLRAPGRQVFGPAPDRHGGELCARLAFQGAGAHASVARRPIRALLSRGSRGNHQGPEVSALWCIVVARRGLSGVSRPISGRARAQP